MDRIIKKALEIIKCREGFEKFPYLCPMNFLTVGNGINLDSIDIEYINTSSEEFCFKNKLEMKKYFIKYGITKKQSEKIVIYFLEEIIYQLKTVGLIEENTPKVLQLFMIDLVYNIGYTRFNDFMKLKKAIRERNKRNICKELVDSQWFFQVGKRSDYWLKQIKYSKEVQ